MFKINNVTRRGVTLRDVKIKIQINFEIKVKINDATQRDERRRDVKSNLEIKGQINI